MNSFCKSFKINAALFVVCGAEKQKPAAKAELFLHFSARLRSKLQGMGGWPPNVWEDAITTQGPSRLLRALKRTRAPLTAFGMTIHSIERVSGSRNHSRRGWLGLIDVSRVEAASRKRPFITSLNPLQSGLAAQNDKG